MLMFSNMYICEAAGAVTGINRVMGSVSVLTSPQMLYGCVIVNVHHPVACYSMLDRYNSKKT